MEQEILQVSVVVAWTVELIKHIPFFWKYFKKTLPFWSLPFWILYSFLIFWDTSYYEIIIVWIWGTLLANWMYDQLSILMKAYYDKVQKII